MSSSATFGGGHSAATRQASSLELAATASKPAAASAMQRDHRISASSSTTSTRTGTNSRDVDLFPAGCSDKANGLLRRTPVANLQSNFRTASQHRRRLERERDPGNGPAPFP